MSLRFPFYWFLSAPCSVPSGFRVSTATDESLELSWLPPLEIGAAGLDGYKVLT